jgi:hypothetical protein
MNATSTHPTRRRVPAALKLALGLLTALGLLLSVQGCSTDASATTSPSGPTPAEAMQVFSSYVTAEKVALADHNELLALSMMNSAAYSAASSAFTIAAASGSPVAAPVYGQPTLYVPKPQTYPEQWFMVAVPEHPAAGGPSQVALMLFTRSTAAPAWALTGSTLLNPGVPAPDVTVDSAGYATAVSVSDQELKVRPNVVGPLHATVADDGPASPAMAAVAAGPETTGLYASNAALAKQAAARKQSYQWLLEGTSYPEFALRTADGGALVFYCMYLTTTTSAPKPPVKNSKAPLPVIPVPAAYRGLLPANQPALHHTLSADALLEYAAIDPASASTAKIQVIGTGGGPNYAKGS